MESGDKIYFENDGHPVAVDEIDFLAAMDVRLAGKPVKDGDRDFLMMRPFRKLWRRLWSLRP